MVTKIDSLNVMILIQITERFTNFTDTVKCPLGKW